MKYLVVGANGYGNIGDDLCALSAKYMIEQVDRKAEVTITSPPFITDLAKRADVIVLGGGGLLYDSVPANVSNYVQYLDYAQNRGKRTMALGMGVQGIRTDWGKEEYQRVLSKCDLVTARSDADKDFLESIGVDNVHATQDLAFIADRFLVGVADKVSTKPVLGLALVDIRKFRANGLKRDEVNERVPGFISALHNNIPDLLKKFDVRLIVHSRDDIPLYMELKEAYPDVTIIPYRNPKDIDNVWRHYLSLDIMIGSRFHSMVLAILAGKPIIGMATKDTKQYKLAHGNAPSLLDNMIDYTPGMLDLTLRSLPDIYGKITPVPINEREVIDDRVIQNVALLQLWHGKIN